MDLYSDPKSVRRRPNNNRHSSRQNTTRRHSTREDFDYYDYRPSSRPLPPSTRSLDLERKKDELAKFNHKAVMKYGYLQYKKVVGFSKRFVVLIAPDSVQDILQTHRILFSQDPIKERENPLTVPLLGQIANSAVEGCPLLLIYPTDSPTETNNINFVHFANVNDIFGEQRLGAACTFQVTLKNRAEYKFVASNSTEYQSWFKQIEAAFSTISAARSQIGGVPILPNPLITTESGSSEVRQSSQPPSKANSIVSSSQPPSKANSIVSSSKPKTVFKRVSTVVNSIFGNGSEKNFSHDSSAASSVINGYSGSASGYMENSPIVEEKEEPEEEEPTRGSESYRPQVPPKSDEESSIAESLNSVDKVKSTVSSQQAVLSRSPRLNPESTTTTTVTTTTTSTTA
ncbi:hypothetical protein HK098_000755 [Nowakowskiella sp. JEL0407]|nr:hypothetical protein HK098_000755 [Nowakowskiella sp. JEL0407]